MQVRMTLKSKLLLNPLPQLKHKLFCPVLNKLLNSFNHTCDLGPQQVYLAPSFKSWSDYGYCNAAVLDEAVRALGTQP